MSWPCAKRSNPVCEPAVEFYVCVATRPRDRTVHDALMRTDDHLQAVGFAELLDAIRAECDKARAARIRAQSHDAVILGRVAAKPHAVQIISKGATCNDAAAHAPPQQVHEHNAARLHGERALQLLELLHALNGFSDAACDDTRSLKSQEAIRAASCRTDRACR